MLKFNASTVMLLCLSTAAVFVLPDQEHRSSR